MPESTGADAGSLTLAQLATKLREDLAAARAIGDGKADSVRMPNGSVIEIGEAHRKRAELMFVLRAVRPFVELVGGVTSDDLRSLGWGMIALANIERGATDPLFCPTNGRPGAKANLKEEFELSDAAAAVAMLIDHKCCPLAADAWGWVERELRRRGVTTIKGSAIDRHRRRFGGELRKAEKKPGKHKPAIVLAKRHYDETMVFGRRHYDDLFVAGVSETEAAWVAAERMLDRIVPVPEGKPYLKAGNVRRGLKQQDAG